MSAHGDSISRARRYWCVAEYRRGEGRSIQPERFKVCCSLRGDRDHTGSYRWKRHGTMTGHVNPGILSGLDSACAASAVVNRSDRAAIVDGIDGTSEGC